MTKFRTQDDVVNAVERRLSAFKSPLFDRTIVEALLLLIHQWRHDAHFHKAHAEAAEKSVYSFVRRGNVLYPETVYDISALAGVKDGQRVNARITLPASLDALETKP